MGTSWDNESKLEFAALLKKLIGNSKGKDLSEATGIAQSRISSFLNGKEQFAPTLKTINKLFRGKDVVNGVTKDQMLVAAGRIKISTTQRVDVEYRDVYRTYHRRQLNHQYLAAISSVAAKDWGCKPNLEKRSNFALCLEISNLEFAWYFWTSSTNQNASNEKTNIRRMVGMIAEFPISNNTKYTYFTTDSELFLRYFNMSMPALPALNANVSILYLDEETMMFAEHILAETTEPSNDVRKHHF